MYNYISYSEKDTIEFSKKIASKLHIGDVVILSGELGSGKTKFTEGILNFFSISEEISSPTFTIVNEHKKNNTNIFHFDLYRLNDLESFYNIGGEEYFSKGISIIEWGELIEPILNNNYLKLIFEKDDNDENIRKIKIIPYGDRFEKSIKNIAQKLI